MKLSIPPQSQTSEASEICTFRLAWSAPDSRERQVLRATLRLPVLGESQWRALKVNSIVSEQVAHKQGLRLRRRSIDLMESGDFEAASESLGSEADFFAGAPLSADLRDEELQEIATLKESIAGQRHAHSTKLARFSHYRKTRGR